MPPRKRAPAKKTAAAKAKETQEEPTPIGDDAAHVATTGDSVHFDEIDVPAALAKQTDDGPGDLDKLPESNWQGYATEGVEQEVSK
jgi:hypothetical protein